MPINLGTKPPEVPKVPTASLTWHVVATYEFAEAMARSRLEGQDFEVRIFHMVEVEVVRGSKRERKEPLFPGYLFVADPTGRQRWSKVGNTRGVYKLLTSVGSKAPAVLDSRIVVALEAEEARGAFRIDNSPRQYGRGERVAVEDGSLEAWALRRRGVKSLVGICQKHQGDRVQLLFSWLEEKFSVDVLAEHTRPG